MQGEGQQDRCTDTHTDFADNRLNQPHAHHPTMLYQQGIFDIFTMNICPIQHLISGQSILSIKYGNHVCVVWNTVEI